MNRIKELSKEEWGRDYVFDYIISLFGNKPTKIGEVGCARDPNGRAGDGWSTFFWAKYLNKYGGEVNEGNLGSELNLLTQSFDPSAPVALTDPASHTKN